MGDQSPFPPRGASLHQGPRKQQRDRTIAAAAEPTTTTTISTTSPERRRRNEAPAQRERAWPRAKGAPAAINVSGTQYRADRGQQFTVGNVSNGLIYLRPVIRPAHELQQQHQHNFASLPTTPPNSAEEIEERRRERAMVGLPQHAYDESCQASPPRTPTASLNPAVERNRENNPYIKSSPPVAPTRHQRSRSYSTVDERFHPNGGSAGPTLQILIDQCDGPAPEGVRPRTAGHQNAFHSLEVQIPHYNLGSPRFSPGGTPFLYGSSSLHLPSTIGEMGSSRATSQHIDGRWLWPSVDPRSLSPAFSSRDGNSPMATSFSYGGMHRMSSLPSIPQALSPSPLVPSSAMNTFPPIPSPPIPSTHAPADINPEIYDRLSFPPGSEDQAIVRYDARQEISAAIPARIIAQITSAAFVDYHLLSDFFLTYRLFMNARDLAAHLVARLRWAIDRGDDTGKVVRVRTFVAIRHWLLNYFADDFVPSLVFRQEFVKILNDLTHAVRANGNASDLKIIGELKKCWRRTCALYWDNMDNPDANVDEDIKPGGPPGTREETLQRPQSTMLRVSQLTTPPPRLDIVQPDNSSGTESFIRDVIQRRAATMIEKRDGSKTGNNSTLQSRTRSTVHSKSSASAPISPSQPEVRKASSSNNLSTKHKLPGGPHKRSGSFSDALRDHRYPLPLPNSIAKSTHLLMALPYAGSLVRGNRFPPTPAFVEVIAPSTPVNEFASFNFDLPASSSSGSAAIRPMRPSEKHLTIPNKATNAPGMKRLFGSVRKALGGKSTSQLSVSRGDKSAAVSNEHISRSSSTRSHMSAIETLAANASRLGMGTSGDGKVARVDLLGAGAVDAFQRAMMAAENTQGRHESSAAVTSGDEASRDGDLSSLRGMDGAVDGSKTDLLAEVGSNISEIGDNDEDPRHSFASQIDRKDFLDSPSTISASPRNPSPQNRPTSLLGGMSFLADESEPDGSSQNSIVQPLVVERKEATPSPAPTMETRSLLVRRSKSFSFERTPSPYMRHIGNIDENSSFIHRTGVDVRSLHSARSFSINRVNSMLSQFSTPMDNISEFNEFRSFARDNEDILPARGLLRRRPGGNLRAAAHVGDLDQPRPMSTGSIATAPFSLEEDLRAELQSRPRQRAFSPATCSSEVSGPHPIAVGVVSLGAMGKNGGATCPQEPTVDESAEEAVGPGEAPVADARASFEAGVQMLRELPDDEDDDGGLEVALAKLEGTYQRKRSGDTSPTFNFRMSMARLGSREMDSSLVVVSEPGYDGVDDDDEDEEDDEDEDDGYDGPEHNRRLRRRHKQVLDQHPLETPPMIDGNTSSNRSDLVREESEDSIRILERGLSINAFGGGKFGGSRAGDRGMDLSHVDSKLETHLESPYPGNDDDDDDDDDDNASQLSSELSFGMVQQGSANGTYPSATPGTIIQELGIPSHPLRHPPSPPLTLEQALSLPNRTSGDSFRTPRHTPRSAPGNIDVSPHSQSTRQTETPRRSRESAILEPTAIHLPFILAYDSELLAKQFTLIEKDALLEIDWKELVELSWSQADTDVKDWVELLNSRDIKGVEVVIARFNLMCRWARSEVVMTKSIDERARTIVKLIHIAAHARQMYNYATMYQITIALLTADIARLRKTWQLVSAAEMHTFRELEALVQPVRNFHNLRVEMEKVTGESGCIPFVGLFTHDLILNAQRPPLIHFAVPNMQPLVNFERHRMTAAIVKRLLRLIEASHKYSFVAVDGVCERCLWISALDDDEIRGLSKGIELVS